MKRTAVAALVVLFLVGPPRLEAQEPSASLTLYGNLLLPVGKFGEDIGANAETTRRFGFSIGEEAGLATTGFGAGAEFRTPVLTRNLFWVLSARYLSNPCDVTVITSFFRDDLHDTVDVSFEFGNWTNVPLFTGFLYSVDVTDDIAAYGIIQAGVNISQQASRKAFVAGTVVEETTFDFKRDFGFELGLGVHLFGHYDVGVRYLNLGSPTYSGTRKLNELFFTSIPKREMNVDGDERPIALVLITLGYTF